MHVNKGTLKERPSPLIVHDKKSQSTFKKVPTKLHIVNKNRGTLEGERLQAQSSLSHDLQHQAFKMFISRAKIQQERL